MPLASLSCIAALLLLTADGRDPAPLQLMRDPGFEALPAARLETNRSGGGWVVQRTGRPAIQDQLGVACVADAQLAHAGDKLLRLSLPKETVGFEFVTVGQRLSLEAGWVYEASVWVRWPDGPEQAPAKASSASGHPSAIVSFWIRHKNLKGEFAGRDVWLFDRQWKKLSFRFCTTDPEQKSFLYVSLLPNQTPRATTVLVDDFTLTAGENLAAAADERAECVAQGDFSAAEPGPLPSGAWSFSSIGKGTIAGEVVEVDGGKCFRISMSQGTSNYQSAQLRQMLDLKKGVRYEVQCRMRLEIFAQGAKMPIVNYGLYNERTNTWYGPVDQLLRPSGEWETYRFVHIPPDDGPWKLYVQLNGWGNFGNPLTVSFDDFSSRPAVSGDTNR